MPDILASVLKYTKETFDFDEGSVDLSCTKFANKLFVVVTQYKKIGNLVLVTKESSANSGDNTIFNTRVLLGNDRDLLHVIAKTLAEPLQSEVPVLIGISLKNESASLVKRIAARLTVLTQSL